MKNRLLLAFCSAFPLFIAAQSDSSSVSCVRNITVTEKHLEVKIIIHKPARGGFARIYEKLPPGATVSQVKCGKAVYKSEKSMLKIVWDNIPEKESEEITYHLRLAGPVEDTMKAITGTFSSEFLQGTDENMVIQYGQFTRLKKSDKISDAEITRTQTEIVPDPEKNNPAETTDQKIKPNVSDTGVYICIQVAAVGYAVKQDYLNKTFGYPGEFDTHFEDNIYRLTVGRFTSQSDAEAVMQEYKLNYFKKCFLSAYHNGKKITVSEANRLLR